MQVPLETIYHGVDRSEWSENFIRRQTDRLERYADDIISCHVTVECPHRHRHTGNPHRVRVEVRLPDHKALVAVAEPDRTQQPPELRTVIRDAFKAMERQVLKANRVRRYDVKTHEEPHGIVVRLFPEAGYGFIKDPLDTEEYYFHRHAVLHDDFERLTVGTEVRFDPEEGEEGPQASTVQIVSKVGPAGDGEQPDVPTGWGS